LAFRIFRNGLQFNLDSITSELTELAIERVAILKAIELYANTFSKCEFQWYDKDGKRLAEPEYLLNIRPNINQNATVFWHDTIVKMFSEGEALVFQGKNKELYLADSFDKKQSLYFDDIFSNIKSRSIPIASTFNMSDVLFFELNQEYKELINIHFKKLGSVVDYAVEDYKQSNGKKYAFYMPASFNRSGIGNTVSEEELKNKAQEYVEKIFKKLFESFNAVIPFQKEEKLEEIGKSTGKSVTEIKTSIETIFEVVAIGLGIPMDIFFGKTTEKSKALDEWITLELGTVFEQFTDEANAKLITKNDYLKGERISIDTTRIKHRDVLDSANDIDKLHANGFTLNEIFELMGMPKDKKDPNSDKRFFTKNQEKSVDNNMKGGE
jgi:HK97 family phage portal protein